MQIKIIILNSVDSGVVQSIRKTNKHRDMSRMSQNHFYTFKIFITSWRFDDYFFQWCQSESHLTKIITCNICSVYINVPSFFFLLFFFFHTAIIVLGEASAPPFSREQICSHYLKAKTVHLTSHCASRSADKQCNIVAKPYVPVAHKSYI